MKAADAFTHELRSDWFDPIKRHDKVGPSSTAPWSIRQCQQINGGTGEFLRLTSIVAPLRAERTRHYSRSYPHAAFHRHLRTSEFSCLRNHSRQSSSRCPCNLDSTAQRWWLAVVKSERLHFGLRSWDCSFAKVIMVLICAWSSWSGYLLVVPRDRLLKNR
jgi:hypothetical protein